MRRVLVVVPPPRPPPIVPYTTTLLCNMPCNTVKHRTQEHGFEVCNHTYKQTCINKQSHSILWAKEGNSCICHAKQMDLHPDCKAPCPAGVSGDYIWDVKPGDISTAIQSMLDGDWNEDDIDAFFLKNLSDWKEGRENWPALSGAW